MEQRRDVGRDFVVFSGTLKKSQHLEEFRNSF